MKKKIKKGELIGYLGSSKITTNESLFDKEIKEILKILKKCEFGACITKHNSRVLLDYITNLEKELKELKQNKLVDIDYQDMEQRYKNYKSRNKKAIEYIENELIPFGDK